MDQISKNIFLVKNILTDEQREELLETSKSLLLDLGGMYPGKQTLGTLHTIPKLKSIFDCMLQHMEDVMNYKFDIKNAWVNWTNGKDEDLNWHTHLCHYSMVYYMSPFNCGTLFRDKFVETELNSLIIFPATMEHTAPTSPSRIDRYTLAMELNLNYEILFKGLGS